uniref:Capsid protein n=1 Tax=Dulem virus 52 TaxID=3145763 RepID=A0AAU8B4Q0_9VIRU
MCLCSHSWYRRLILCFFAFQFLYVQVAYSFVPIAIGGRIVLTRVLGNVVARRAVASVAANDASIVALRTMQTYRALGTVAANDARFALGATSTLRHAKDISWVALALGSGVISLSDLNVEGNDKLSVAFEPSAIKLSDGRYAIQVNGETKVVNANPSRNDPVIYQYSKEKKQISDELSDVYKSDILDNRYKYFDELRTGEYAQSNSLEKLSEYISQEEWGGKGEENYLKVNIDGKEYQYLYSQTTVENRYLRHQQIGDIIHPTVRQTFTEKQLRYDFNPMISGYTGESTVYSFNPPKESDYEISTRTATVSYINFKINENWVGDNIQTSPQEQQLGSIADLDLGLYTQPLTATQLAQLFNALMMSAASQANYDGIPFTSTNPITANEVNAVLTELGITPTYADLFAKAGTGDNLEFDYHVSPSPNPVPTPNPRPNDGEFNEDIDMSELEYPELESPTARQILEPLKQFFPEFQKLHIQEKGASCPTWSFDALNRTYTIDGHCTLLEKNRNLFSSVFILIWSIIAIRRLLSA